ncbi:hypothetical protein OG711_08105 [Streptomyces uncialis]|uniref:hypothetical protein n=1 Tax=Streptomyces uncialis TaxID=1048205 RepID=UPI002E35CC94|nr:hypothetical protein [Streptomyces uncialis]
MAWLILNHDELFDNLGEPSMSVREIDAMAALAPMETEFATTAAVRRLATGEVGLTRAVEGLALEDQINTLAICTTVILLEGYGRDHALKHVEAETAEDDRRGCPKPYTIT